MKLSFPPAAFWLKSVLLALVFAVIGFLLFPVLVGEGNQQLFAATLFVGAFLGAIAAATSIRRSVRAAREGDVQTLFVGNLPFKSSEGELRELFSKYGEVRSVRIMKDRKTRRPRGYGFVELDGDVRKAIKGLDGRPFLGRELKVKEGNQRGNGHELADAD